MKLSCLTVLLCVIVACGSSKEGGTAGQWEIIELEDGTRCFVWDGYYAGGVDCDWD